MGPFHLYRGSIPYLAAGAGWGAGAHHPKSARGVAHIWAGRDVLWPRRAAGTNPMPESYESYESYPYILCILWQVEMSSGLVALLVRIQ